MDQKEGTVNLSLPGQLVCYITNREELLRVIGGQS